MYMQQTVYMKNSIEIYKYFTGRYGKKIINSPAQRKTPLNQIRYQDKKAERICRWKLNMNFKGGDLWLTLTYPSQSKITSEKARNDMKLFLERLRYLYKKSNKKLKYIYVAGRTKRGNVHFHIVLNANNTAEITRIWQNIAKTEEQPYPIVNIKHLYDNGNYAKLAAYMIKNSRETYHSNDKIHKKRFCASLNLENPTIQRKIINAKNWKIEPKAIKGYQLDKNSVYNGYGWADNGTHWEGCRIQRYTLISIESINKNKIFKSKRKIPEIPEIIEEWS